MTEKILDLHIHSKYSRACSPQLELPKIARACEEKGIDIVATGDYTHPAWFGHIKDCLTDENSGIYTLKNSQSRTKFILSTEVSCIYRHRDKTRRLHLVLLAPSIAAVEKLNNHLEQKGINLKSDGRPIMGLSAKELLKIMLDIDEKFFMIPAHAWTPWFAIFGSKSGYDSIEECFEELSSHIRAVETGLSSDPPMNHRLSQLDNIVLVSNSDAHSLDKLGREANVFEFASEVDVTYEKIVEIIKSGDKNKFLYTIEFYPEEGMYHFDGHAVCEVRLAPADSKKQKNICPKCKKGLTIGVLHRVDDLADRPEDKIPQEKFIPHKYIVPLREIIAKVFEVGVGSKRVATEYAHLIKNLGSEFNILLDQPLEKIAKVTSDSNVALAIQNMRSGQVKIRPGYDGVYGQVEPIFVREKYIEKQGRLL